GNANDATFNTTINAKLAEAENHLKNSHAKAYDLTYGIPPRGPAYEGDEALFARTAPYVAFESATGKNVKPANFFNNTSYYTIYSTNPQNGYMTTAGDAFYNSDWIAPILNSWEPSAFYEEMSGGDAAATTLASLYYTAALDPNVSQFTGYQHSSMWTLLLYHDKSRSLLNYSSLPKSKYFGNLTSTSGMDTIFARSAWNDNRATNIQIDSSDFLYGHQHKDAGHFNIMKMGDLAIDSGAYVHYNSFNTNCAGIPTGLNCGAKHALNYYEQTIAHNTLSVFDPVETFIESGYTIINTGGQYLPVSDPSYTDYSNNTNPATNSNRTADMKVFEDNGTIMGAKTDLSPAYMSSKASSGYTNKLNYYYRYYVFIRPNYFIVFDKIKSRDATFPKWSNVHFKGEPTINGTATVLAGSQSAGITKFSNADTITSTDTNFSNQYSGTSGRLFTKVLLPANNVIRKIGGGDPYNGSGYRFWVPLNCSKTTLQSGDCAAGEEQELGSNSSIT
ncbi:MAG: heparinase II/III family protein, partial [Nitrosarchaeum sp.]|nr:heparinase II/III family protein [Nitrosarchaeum sp.]